MSRGTPSSVCFGNNHVIELGLEKNEFVQKALRLCNPTLVDFHVDNFETFWSDANKLVLSLIT